MISLLKLLGKGLLYIILLPVGIVVFALYGIGLFFMWICYFFKTIFNYFRGKKSGLILPEDIKAIEILNASRDFSTPVAPPAQAPGVTFNFNVNGQHVGQQNGRIIHDSATDQDVIDISHDSDVKKIEGDK
jgi:hypothetical protein